MVCLGLSQAAMKRSWSSLGPALARCEPVETSLRTVWSHCEPTSDLFLTCLVLSGACLRLSWTQSSSQETTKTHQVHPVLFFARNLQPQETPKTPQVDPILFFTSILVPNLKKLCFLSSFWLPAIAASRLEIPQWALWRRCMLLKNIGFSYGTVVLF